ncbi:hypothetical protein BJ322DRAFT_369970 [Thelephora terrestris]|uniref:Zn(2)-C6 fungal-type domain-containing protein n=1 Tax=Thelephora terrestris TaxID=56493 RepID=A0A9P6L2N1_9AGAM|nr:hypothetical protein BJ322DRAFT_369970 [Thelephora terrestris]
MDPLPVLWGPATARSHIGKNLFRCSAHRLALGSFLSRDPTVTSFSGAMSTKSQGACAACRIRKAKCIPGTPRCVRCVTLGIQDCRYAPVKKRGAGSILRMGEACVPCRQKKSKCDAKQPCTTCVIRDGGAACTYEGPRSGGRVLYLRERSPTPSKRLKWIPSPHVLERTAPVLSSDTSVIEEACETTECPPPPTMPSLTILPSIRFQAIPRPLPLPSSIIPAERLQVSWGPGNDLDMSFRLRALCQLNKLGLYFIPEKQEAIIRGDTSNSVIHRHFVDGAHVMGVHFCGPEVTPAVVRLQARYSQTSWESLIQLNQTNQERDKAQALLLVAYSCVIVGLNAGPQLYLLKACKIIEKAGLQFLPESGLPVEYSEQVREDASVLSQAIYLENYVHLTLGGSAPAKTARIEREFRTGLQRRRTRVTNKPYASIWFMPWTHFPPTLSGHCSGLSI